MRLSIVLTLLVAMPGLSFASGIDFFHGTWDEALTKAKEEGKVIFVDAYTTWCGPCKKMAREVFSDAKVGDYYNKYFVNLKLDMEKKEGIKFGGKYPVKAYPTLYFIDAKGEVVQKVKGAQNKDAFLSLGKSIISKVDFSKDYAEAYEKGDRDPQLVLDYVKALNKVGKPSGKIVNDYLRTQKDLNTEYNLIFLYEAVAEADSRIFDLFVKHKKDILKHKTEGEYLKRIEQACKQSVNKAIEYDSPDLLTEAKAKMKSNHSLGHVAFAYEADMRFSAAKKDQKTYIKSADAYAKKVGGKNPEILFDLCKNCLQSFPDNKEILKAAIAYNEKANDLQARPEYGFHLAQLYFTNSQKDKAKAVAQQALDSCEENSSLASQIKRFLAHISAS